MEEYTSISHEAEDEDGELAAWLEPVVQNRQAKDQGITPAALNTSKAQEALEELGELTSRIVQAFQRPDELRTLGGIARAIELPSKTVAQVLEARPDIFVRSKTISPAGTAAYKLRTAPQAKSNSGG